ncbi:transposase [Marinobacterium aestuariivivens]|uniref:Transposase n=1 Tax=Marinobacterium aestuariivivens TaxID=1698799 RepID=A0ABW2AA02_9GAMM
MVVLQAAAIAPERFIKTQLLQDSSSSERQLVEQISYNLLYHCFVWLISDDPVGHHSSFSTSRAQLLEHDVVTKINYY